MYPDRWAAAAAVIIAVALAYALVPSTDRSPPVPGETQAAWMDEARFEEEIAEISTEIEMLELGALATLWEGGNGSNGTVPESINGESRRPWDNFGREIGVPG
jgi:hypothetical protein